MDFLSKLCIQTLIFGCKTVNKTYSYCQQIYKTNYNIRKIIWSIKYILCSLQFQYIEPLEYPWISKSSLIPTHYMTQRYSFHEKYNTSFNEMIPSIFDTSISLDKEYENSSNCIGQSTELVDCPSKVLNRGFNDYQNDTTIFIMKLLTEEKEERYFICTANEAIIPTITCKKSRAKFISIEYKHPEMTNSIEIVLDRAWFYSGNEIFTPTFVMRTLKYQSQYFIFDMNYQIIIMDNDLNIIKLDYETSLLFSECGYQIVKHDRIEDTYGEMEWKEIYELTGQFLNDIS